MNNKNSNVKKGNFNRNKTNKRIKVFSRKMKAKLVRLYVVILAVFIGLGVVITRIYAKSGDKYAAKVLSQQDYTSKTIPFKRGDILDRNGNVLATSIKVYNLILDPVIMLDDKKYLDPTVEALIKCFGFTKEDLMKTINDNKEKRYVVYKKQLKYEEIKEFEALLNDKKKNPNIKGVWFEHEYKRMYPYSTVASGTIGFSLTDNVGRWGIEEYYNDYLNGVDGREYGYVNQDNAMEPVVREATNGNSVVSTIDLNLQTICEKYVAQWVADYNPQTVAVVMANPNNGEILAMADNTNIFDLNNPRDMSRYYTQEQLDAMTDDEYTANLSKMWRNFCVSDSYEAGSTIKPFTVAGALEEGKITKDQTFLCDGSETIGTHTIHCHKRSGHGTQNVEQAIMNSCNDSLMQIAALEGVDAFCKYQSLFGFGMKTGIDLPGEASCDGLLYTKDNMKEVDLATNSFGQNFNVNMIQMVAGFSSIINGGNYYKPHTAKQIINEKGGVVENYDKQLIKQTVTKDTSDFLRQALMNTVVGGTGKTAAVSGYSVGGKTGTAQHHQKDDPNYLLSFLGFAPYDNPQVVCYVIVDAPDVDDKSSSAYASKLFSAIMTEALPYLDIFPAQSEQAPQQETTTVQPPANTQEQQTTTQPSEQSFDESYQDGPAVDNDVLNQEQPGDNVPPVNQ